MEWVNSSRVLSNKSICESKGVTLRNSHIHKMVEAEPDGRIKKADPKA